MARTVQQPAGTSANAEAIEAWDGPLFDAFVRFRGTLVAGLQSHGDLALAEHPPPVGGRVLDIGCGFGDMSQQLATLIGPEGSVLGVDAAPRFIEAAREEAREAGVANVEFRVEDLEAAAFEERFDAAYSRMGTMFFANPVAALRRVGEALVPGGRLVMVVWRSKEENEWVSHPLRITESFVLKPEEYEEPTCGPGPFSMANADTTSGILLSAGFEAISLRRCDLPVLMGADVEDAVEMVMTIGPSGEILRLAGERAAHLHAPIAEALREAFAEYGGPDGVRALASTWIVSATAPAA
ncbi:MAG: class I SAM-dependent methyltransferase [Solirubrobacterales bacterium]|nr:class I SAM-dependent methyltransferase [Solirubrobacterales bacterium]